MEINEKQDKKFPILTCGLVLGVKNVDEQTVNHVLEVGAFAVPVIDKYCPCIAWLVGRVVAHVALHVAH